MLRRDAGQPLRGQVAGEMRGAFGDNFSDVRLHTGALAARSAAAVGADAFTIGNDIVFAAGKYLPGSAGAARLLAHELAHVVQQRGQRGDPKSLLSASTPVTMSTPGDAGEREADAAADAVMNGRPVPRLGPATASVQRECSEKLGKPDPDCEPSDAGAGGWAFLFKVGCDDLLPGEEVKLEKLKPGSRYEIHGFASREGPPGFNLDLSCHRANRIADLISHKRPDCPVVGTFKHGASPVPVPGMIPDPHPLSFWRTVIVQESRPAPKPPLANVVCGPDVTDWLMDMMATAKKDPRVLSVRDSLRKAQAGAALIGPGLDAMDMMEGQLLIMIQKAWESAGKPPHTLGAENMQRSDPSAVMGLLELQTAMSRAATGDLRALTTLLDLRDAATAWAGLVGHNGPYDLKRNVLKNPKSPHCPASETCENTITLCPGSPGSNCYTKDLPGNMVFAHIGAFVGFSENALQLGSQWAQLQPLGGKHWDPPEDTQMIDFAFNLPTFTRAAFCQALQGAKSGFESHHCADCPEKFTEDKR
ncbi:MAG TPA: DUF4157 domain-containing protein [Steroidobacteraceae bacterium]|nr:DUF4157 domain-containing protein [Steroidobacteraceae bacterium]